MVPIQMTSVDGGVDESTSDCVYFHRVISDERVKSGDSSSVYVYFLSSQLIDKRKIANDQSASAMYKF